MAFKHLTTPNLTISNTGWSVITGFRGNGISRLIPADQSPISPPNAGAFDADPSLTTPPVIGATPTVPNFIVEGTGANDLIDAAYSDDPQGDRVDNNDAANGSNEDFITAGAGNDTVFSGLGNDNVFGGLGNDSINAGDGNDSINGGVGNDSIDGGVGDDSINASEGNDTIVASLGNDSVRGAAGNDRIEGGDGNDILEGGSNLDTLFGGTGNDNIDGGANEDTLFGGDGNDTLAGDQNNDELTGGSGNDDFLYTPGDGSDTITDFNFGNSGSIRDGDQSNNDFINLAPFYNASSLSNVNAAGGDFKNALSMLQRDAADMLIDGNIEGLDFSAQIGEINLTIRDIAGDPVTRPDLTFDNTNVACFCRGTIISTLLGPRKVEELKPDDLILTVDEGYQPLRLALSRLITKSDLDKNPKLYPICISKGALADNLPEKDLHVSRQHRILMQSDIASDMLESKEVLVSAIKLTNLPNIYLDDSVEKVEYFHLVFDNHQLIYSNGSPSESFYPGPESVKTLSKESYEEFVSIFSLQAIQRMRRNPARKIPTGRQQKDLVNLHKTHRKPCLEPA